MRVIIVFLVLVVCCLVKSGLVLCDNNWKSSSSKLDRFDLFVIPMGPPLNATLSCSQAIINLNTVHNISLPFISPNTETSMVEAVTLCAQVIGCLSDTSSPGYDESCLDLFNEFGMDYLKRRFKNVPVFRNFFDKNDHDHDHDHDHDNDNDNDNDKDNLIIDKDLIDKDVKVKDVQIQNHKPQVVKDGNTNHNVRKRDRKYHEDEYRVAVEYICLAFVPLGIWIFLLIFIIAKYYGDSRWRSESACQIGNNEYLVI